MNATSSDGPHALLSALVATPSPSGSESACADLVVAWCAANGLDATRIEDNVVVRVSSGLDGPRLLLTSHLDTVPVGAGWNGDPFDGTWHGGRLTARGANDAKASVAAMLWTAKTLAASRSPLAGELVVACNVSEETSNAGMRVVLDHLAAAGLPLDAAVVGEPTALEVVRAQAGLCVLEATWHGTSCHAAHVARTPHVNALVRAAEELATFGAFRTLATEHPLIPPSSLTPTVLESGTRHNVVPDTAKAVFDARLAPPDDAADCLTLLTELLPGADVTVRSDRLRAVDTPADHPLVTAALAASGSSAAIGSSTLSDMALLCDLPAIKCGPGETQRSHTANEYVTATELSAGVGFYSALVPRALAALALEPVA